MGLTLLIGYQLRMSSDLILFIIGNTNIRGPINVVSPNPVKASDFFEIIFQKYLENQIFLNWLWIYETSGWNSRIH